MNFREIDKLKTIKVCTYCKGKWDDGKHKEMVVGGITIAGCPAHPDGGGLLGTFLPRGVPIHREMPAIMMPDGEPA